MKKIILFVLLSIFLTGCTNINNSTYYEIIEQAINSDTKIFNTYRTGYKFYLPHGLYVSSFKNNNESLKTNDNVYYMHVDLIGYLNKKQDEYQINPQSIYSNTFNHNELNGYIEINPRNDKYFVEIMYNYAKIEVMVEENSLKKAVADMVIILSSIEYNDEMLRRLESENLLNYSEVSIDIFKKTSNNDNSNFLKYVEEFDNKDDNSIPDYDLIN